MQYYEDDTRMKKFRAMEVSEVKDDKQLKRMVEKPNGDIDWFTLTFRCAIPTANRLVKSIGSISLRTLHYNLVSRAIIPNTSNAYDKLGSYIRDARKSGKLPWESIIDETRRTIKGFSYDYYFSPKKYVEATLGELTDLSKDYKDKILYKWFGQSCYVEVWLEKNALVGTFRKFLAGKDIRLVPNRGYGSWTYAYENCKRLRDMMYEFDMNGDMITKEIHILYFGDFDPSGVDMDAFLENDQLAYFKRYFGLRNVHFHRIAITREQIRKYGLPANPDTKTRAKLDRDSRTEDFVRSLGGELYAVELDALLAYKPDEFRRLVQDTVDQYYKPKVFTGLVKKKEHSRKTIRGLAVDKVKQWLQDQEAKINKETNNALRRSIFRTFSRNGRTLT